MPKSLLPSFIKRMESVEKKLIEVQTDQKWFKWIIISAAGLGFIEKVFGWIVK